MLWSLFQCSCKNAPIILESDFLFSDPNLITIKFFCLQLFQSSFREQSVELFVCPSLECQSGRGHQDQEEPLRENLPSSVGRSGRVHYRNQIPRAEVGPQVSLRNKKYFIYKM